MQINKIKIKDWCIFEDFEYEPKQKNYISGDNETGKSRFGSAITWVLNGTDINGDTLQDVVPVHREQSLTPTVSLDLSITDSKGIIRPATIEKLYKAQFTRDKTFTGEHKTIYKLNGVEITQKKYQEWVKENICDLEVFNMLSNIKVFTEKLKTTGKELIWQKQRRIVESLVGDMPDEFEMVQTQEKYNLLQDGLLRHKTATDYLKAIKTEQSELQKTIDEYPIKRNIIENSIVETEYTLDELSEMKVFAKTMLEKLEKENQDYRDSQSNNSNAVILDEMTKLKEKEILLEVDYQNELSQYNDKKCKLAFNIRSCKNSLDMTKKDICLLVEEQEATIKSTYADYLKSEERVCKYCGTILSHETTEEQFKINQQNELDKLFQSIKAKKIEYKRVKETLYDIDLAEYNSLIEPSEPKEIKELQEKSETKMRELANIKPVENLADYTERKEKSLQDLENFVKAEMIINKNAEIENDLNSLAKSHKDNMKRKSQLQQLQDLSKEFISERCNIIESKANALFSDTGVSFKMFKDIKTSDDVKETFEIYFNGKEYSKQLSLSTQTIVSYIITLALQKAYNVSVPIVCDNMESVCFNEDVTTQIFLLTRTEENCPKCNSKSGRRTITGEWICSNCGETWKKKLGIKAEALDMKNY